MLVHEPPHPDGRELSDFERCLWRLRMISHEAHLLHCSALLPEGRKNDTALLFTLTNYGILLVCKFLEIWDDFNALGKDNRRVREITAAVSPAVRRITRTWPQIRQYRNWAIAHPYSINEEREITPPWSLLDREVGPTQHAEVIVLLECVRFAVAGTLAYYGDLYRKLGPTFDPPASSATTRGVSDGAEAEAERREIAVELNRRLSEIGVDLGDPVFQEYKCPPPAGA